MTDYVQLAREILCETDDGAELAPSDWVIAELAIEGFLTESEEEPFLKLHRNVTQPGGYTPPRFWGIEHLTCNVVGILSWKGTRVSHIDPKEWECLLPGWEIRTKAAAEALAATCRKVELNGINPSERSVAAESAHRFFKNCSE